jgi:hypothetical protein
MSTQEPRTRAEATAQDLRDTIRQGHELLQDFQATERRVRQLLAEVDRRVEVTAAGAVVALMEEYVPQMPDQLRAAMAHWSEEHGRAVLLRLEKHLLAEIHQALAASEEIHRRWIVDEADQES